MRNERKDVFKSPSEESKGNNSMLEIEEIHTDLEDDGSLRFPRKTLIASILLFIVGSVLLIAGLVEEFVDDDPSKGLSMWVIGAITFIPGFYYSVLFYKAYRAKTLYDRRRILREIPDM